MTVSSNIYDLKVGKRKLISAVVRVNGPLGIVEQNELYVVQKCLDLIRYIK